MELTQFLAWILTQQGLVNWTFIIFIVSIFIYLPKLFNKHFKLVDDLAKNNSQEREEFLKSLHIHNDTTKDMTNKFVWQLNNINQVNQEIIRKLENNHKETSNKLESIHNDIKSLQYKK